MMHEKQTKIVRESEKSRTGILFTIRQENRAVANPGISVLGFLFMCIYVLLGTLGVGILATEGNRVQYSERELAVGGIIVFGIFLFDMIRSRHALSSYILVTAAIAYPFLMQRIPSDRGLLAVLFFLWGLTCLKRERSFRLKASLALWASVTGAVILVIGIMVPSDRLKPYFRDREAVKERIQSRLTEIYDAGGKEVGGVSRGNLNSISRFTGGDEVHLKIRTGDVGSGVYLQGYIAGDYKVNRWQEEKETDFEAWKKGAKSSETKVRNQLFENYSRISGVDTVPQNLEIEVRKADKRYQYVPYGVQYEEGFDMQADTYLKRNERGQNTYSVTYVPMPVSPLDTVVGMDGKAQEERSEYGAYVREQYLQLPKSVKAAFEKTAETVSESSLRQTAEDIRRLLSENTKYDVNPGRVPPGMEFSEYFLYYNQKGFCMHYATTATVLFRMKGIPARFVSGYYASGDAFREIGDGRYEAEITESDAHAWTEIYVDEAGWIPVEVTPGYGNREQAEMLARQEKTEYPKEALEQDAVGREEPENENAERDEENGKEKPEGAMSEAKENDENPLKEKAKSQTGKIGAIAGIPALSAVLTAVAGIWIRSLWKRRKRMGYRTDDVKEQIQILFAGLYEMLVFAGMQETDEAEAGLDSGEFARRAFEICDAVSKEELDRLASVVLNACYGSIEPQKTDGQEVRNLYEKVRKDISKNQNIRRKILFKYWKCF